MLKTTSLVVGRRRSGAASTAQIIYASTYQIDPAAVRGVSLWYLVLSLVMIVGQYYLERHYGRGSSGTAAEPRSASEPAAVQ